MKSPSEYLRDALAGGQLSPADIDHLRSVHGIESLHHDYKSGLMLKGPAGVHAKPAEELRWSVVAFANAEGGLLVVGVHDETKAVDGCPAAIGQRPLADWAHDVLAPVAPYLVPEPRVQVVAHPSGRVLVVAVSPAPNLVEMIYRNQKQAPRRFHDRVEAMPESLVADILHGRRRHPVVEVDFTEARAGVFSLKAPRGYSQTAYSLALSFDLENRSLVDPCQVRVGLVAPSLVAREPVAVSVLEYIDLELPDPYEEYFAWNAVHTAADGAGPGELIELPPFQRSQCTVHSAMTVPFAQGTVQAACYVLPLGSSPEWYQIQLATAMAGAGQIDARWLHIQRVLSGRAVVGFT